MTAVPAALDLHAIGAGLPFAAALPELREALASGAVVVQAPPGSGKTTLVPPAVASHVTQGGRVVVTQPRRVAARAAARRLAHLLGEPVGRTVGFTVRGERETSRATRIEMVTPGVLLRRLVADPELGGVAAVILDEVHERHLDTDLLVALLGEVRQLREDLLVVAMSATLDAARFAEVLGGDHPAEVVSSPGITHPLEVAWRPYAALRQDERGVTPGFVNHVAEVTAVEHRQTSLSGAGSDTLVFLPGVVEVNRVASQLRRTCPGVEVLELHGQVAAHEQDRATGGRTPGDPPRLIVSTPLAESSLTVPGVHLVIDAGLSREPRRDAARGMSGLVTVACSRASAQQRAGRAARTGPGRVVRCYDEDTWRGMPAHVTPQLSTADLTDAALLLAAWGTPGGTGMPWVTPPPPAAMRAATDALLALGATDEQGRLTDLGRRLTRVPVEPRLGRALLIGAQAAGVTVAAEVVAALSDGLRHPTGDLDLLLRELRSGASPSSRRWRAETDRLRSLARRDAESLAGGAGHDRRTDPTGRESARPGRTAYPAGLVVALAHPERVGRRDGDQVLMASGTRAGLPPGAPAGEWLAVADVTRAAGRTAAGTGAVVRLAAELDRATAEQAAPGLLHERVRAQLRADRVVATRVTALGAIELSDTPIRPDRGAARTAIADALAAQGLSVLSWSEPARTLRLRLAFLHRHVGMPWPSVTDEALSDRLDEWFGPEVEAIARGARVGTICLVEPLRRLLPWPEAGRIDVLAPERLAVPSGGAARVGYPPLDGPDARPVVHVKLQECFGWARTPRLADGRVPVLFHLLSPAGRPLAVTDDLASFWSGPYAQVRAEMRGRYPRHPWPEDPWTAAATARTNRRKS